MGKVYRASQGEGFPRPAAGRLAVIKRRTEVVGTLLLEQNDEWAVQRAAA
jgi:hypothetical protein